MNIYWWFYTTIYLNTQLQIIEVYELWIKNELYTFFYLFFEKTCNLPQDLE